LVVSPAAPPSHFLQNKAAPMSQMLAERPRKRIARDYCHYSSHF